MIGLAVAWLLRHPHQATGNGAPEQFPLGDEELTAEEERHIAAALKEGGAPIPWDEVKAKVEATPSA